MGASARAACWIIPSSKARASRRASTRVRFHLSEFFADNAGFLTVAPFRFRIEKVDEHFHLPLKFTRWGYSLFRGA